MARRSGSIRRRAARVPRGLNSDTVGRRCCSDSGDDLDPGLVHRLEPLSLLLGILVWDGADEVVAPAVSSILLGCRSMTILSTSISVSARRSTADRSSHASDGSGSSGMAASLVAHAARTRNRRARDRRRDGDSGMAWRIVKGLGADTSPHGGGRASRSSAGRA